MFYFKQNIKGKNFTELFVSARKLYNQIWHAGRNDINLRFKDTDKVCLTSEHALKLGLSITRSIVGNYNINMTNYCKNQAKDASYRRPSCRYDDSLFFIAFFGSSFEISWNILSLNLKHGIEKFIIPDNFVNKNKSVRMVRLHNALDGSFYLIYEYEDVIITKNTKQFKAGIDLGVDTLIACYSESARPLIISGKFLKFSNYKFNNDYIKAQLQNDTLKMKSLKMKKNNFDKTVFHNALSRLFSYLNYSNVGEIFVGDFHGVKDKGVCNNFYMIPYHTLKRKIAAYANKFGIKCSFINESYTSKTSFLDFEAPNNQNVFEGIRLERGLFVSSKGYKIHADVNGASQILSKRYYVKDRTNAMSKPFYIDLVKEQCKVKSRIKDFIFSEYKTDKKRKEVLSAICFNDFKLDKYLSFNAHTRQGIKVQYFYNIKTRKIDYKHLN
jgi:IS605 OrfB family transposase